ncbi:MAG TPA: FtsQ-type POTRA domain-containing protein [Pyrinomonadaceae bacterium]|nr:FtsQ-type POTRA domain-containing protein [Pyrinomonadaceae bacterium]
MKEQVVTPRAGRGGDGSGRSRSGAITQRPARRDRSSSGQGRGAHAGLRKALGYLPLVTKVVLAVVAGVLVFAGYRAAASASFFQVRSVDVAGTSRVSPDEVKTVVRRAVQPVGVWQADLDALSRELEKIAWVRRAVVSRVLPDGLRVRIVEREQRAVVRTSEGRLVWVDDDAVSLGTLQPNDKWPPFFIRGWDDSGTTAARAENRARVEKYKEMLAEWQKLGLTERVSEVNLLDLTDVRVQLAGDDSQIEVRIGRENFGNRLQRALLKLDETRATPVGPYITYVDASRWMKSGDSVVLGRSPNAPTFDSGSGSNESEAAPKDLTSAPNEKEDGAAAAKKRKQDETARARRDERKKNDKKETEKKERAADDAKRQSRPRRVG